MNAFKIGDVVRLKSGGPRMTVTTQMSSAKWQCAFFVNTKHLVEWRVVELYPECLEHAPDSENSQEIVEKPVDSNVETR